MQVCDSKVCVVCVVDIIVVDMVNQCLVIPRHLLPLSPSHLITSYHVNAQPTLYCIAKKAPCLQRCTKGTMLTALYKRHHAYSFVQKAPCLQCCTKGPMFTALYTRSSMTCTMCNMPGLNIPFFLWVCPFSSAHVWSKIMERYACPQHRVVVHYRGNTVSTLY